MKTVGGVSRRLLEEIVERTEFLAAVLKVLINGLQKVLINAVLKVLIDCGTEGFE
ncbi:MAG TPA: hypothetical protein VIB00_08915 [Pyrinomonadaceae bacterium]